MRDLLKAAPKRLVMAVGAAGLLAVGIGVGSAVIAHPQTGTVSDVAPLPTDTATPAAPTTSAATATDTAAPVATDTAPVPQVEQAPAPVQAPDPATVDTVTTPDPAPAADSTNDPSIGTIAPDGHYVPAAPIQKPGEPPWNPPPAPPSADKLPGEAGYVPPAAPSN